MSADLNGPPFGAQELQVAFGRSVHPHDLELPDLTKRALQCVCHSISNNRHHDHLASLEAYERGEAMSDLFAGRLDSWQGPASPLGTGHQAALGLWAVSQVSDLSGHPVVDELQQGLTALALGQPWDSRLRLSLDISAELSVNADASLFMTGYSPSYSVAYADDEARAYFESLYGEGWEKTLNGWRLPGENAPDNARAQAVRMLLTTVTAVTGTVDHNDDHGDIYDLDFGVLLNAVYVIHSEQGLEAAVDYVLGLDKRIRETISEELRQGPLLSPLDQAPAGEAQADEPGLSIA
jgi:hypothetical protein